MHLEACAININYPIAVSAAGLGRRSMLHTIGFIDFNCWLIGFVNLPVALNYSNVAWLMWIFEV